MEVNTSHSATITPVPISHRLRAVTPGGSCGPPPPAPRARFRNSSSAVGLDVPLRPPGGTAHGLRGPLLSSSFPGPHGPPGVSFIRMDWRLNQRGKVIMHPL